MSYEITGKLRLKEATQQVSDKFQKRDFVVEVENEKNPQWNDFIKIQLTQDRCGLIDETRVDSEIKVFFNLRGRKWEKDGKVSYFNTIEAWRIENLSSPSQSAPISAQEPNPNFEQQTQSYKDDDSLPF